MMLYTQKNEVTMNSYPQGQITKKYENTDIIVTILDLSQSTSEVTKYQCE